MAVYTVYEPPLRPGDADSDPTRFAFVRDGFHWVAFFFAALWMIWHRLWLALIGYLVVAVVLAIGLKLVGAPSAATVAIAFLLALLIGFEAPSLRRWTLARRGWSNLGVVVADDPELAQRRFFDVWVANAGPALPAGSAARASHVVRGDVIGLFPQPGGQP